jgi:hypothetical protein
MKKFPFLALVDARRCSQRGSALVLTLLALIIVAATSAAYFYRQRLEFQIAQGEALFSEMKIIQLAVNKAIFNANKSLVDGGPMVLTLYNASSGAPSTMSIPLASDATPKVPSWHLTLKNLRDAGLLSPGFLNGEGSAIIDAKYQINFYRVPSNCAQPRDGGGIDTSHCLIDGTVALDGIIGVSGIHSASGKAQPLAMSQGAFKSQAGSDLVTSVFKTEPFFIELVKNVTQEPAKTAIAQVNNDPRRTAMAVSDGAVQPNKTGSDVPDLPGLRVGSFNFHLDDLIHMGEQRNLQFGGSMKLGEDMHTGRNLSVGGVAPSMGPQGQPSGAKPCATLTKEGNLNLQCQGQISLVAVQEGQPCTVSDPARDSDLGKPKQPTVRYGALPEGTLASCLANPVPPGMKPIWAPTAPPSAGKWVPLQRFRAAGWPCGSALPAGSTPEPEGGSAIDPQDHQSLVCRKNQYRRTSAMTSDMVLQDTIKLTLVPGDPEHNGFVNKPRCADSGAGNVGQPRIMLASLEEASLGSYPSSIMVSGVTRHVSDESPTQWQVHLERATDKTPLAGTAVVSVFCVYP